MENLEIFVSLKINSIYPNTDFNHKSWPDTSDYYNNHFLLLPTQNQVPQNLEQTLVVVINLIYVVKYG